jgi:hypothetical protein
MYVYYESALRLFFFLSTAMLDDVALFESLVVEVVVVVDVVVVVSVSLSL